MALNLGGGGLFEDRNVTTVGYRSSESGQVETSIAFVSGNNSNYETAYTVPTGKTFYLSSVIYANQGAAGTGWHIATGGAGSEVDVIVIGLGIAENEFFTFNVPIGISADTRISIKTTDAAAGSHFTTLIGWIE